MTCSSQFSHVFTLFHPSYRRTYRTKWWGTWDLVKVLPISWFFFFWEGFVNLKKKWGAKHGGADVHKCIYTHSNNKQWKKKKKTNLPKWGGQDTYLLMDDLRSQDQNYIHFWRRHCSVYKVLVISCVSELKSRRPVIEKGGQFKKKLRVFQIVSLSLFFLTTSKNTAD